MNKEMIKSQMILHKVTELVSSRAGQKPTPEVKTHIIKPSPTSLVAQWLRIHLPVQGHGFQPWSGKIPHAAEQGSRGPCLLSLHSRAREPQLLKPPPSRAHVPQLLSPRAATAEAHMPRAHALQQ